MKEMDILKDKATMEGNHRTLQKDIQKSLVCQNYMNSRSISKCAINYLHHNWHQERQAWVLMYHLKKFKAQTVHLGSRVQIAKMRE